jgi:hypothetical protein
VRRKPVSAVLVFAGLHALASCGPEDRTLVQAESGGSGGDAATCTPPVAGPCDNFPQCGCATGQNCDFANSNGETECVASGPKGAYSQCDGPGQCAVGTTCTKAAVTATSGLCKPFCDETNDCPGDGRVCVPAFGTKGFKYCTLACDLADPSTSCGAGIGCFLTDPEHTDCVVVGSGTGPNACVGNQLNCAPGYFCGDPASAPDCFKWCRLGLGNGDCLGGRQCQDVFPSPTRVAGTQYGACVPP